MGFQNIRKKTEDTTQNTNPAFQSPRGNQNPFHSEPMTDVSPIDVLPSGTPAMGPFPTQAEADAAAKANQETEDTQKDLEALETGKLTGARQQAVRQRLIQNFNDPSKTITDTIKRDEEGNIISQGSQQVFTPLEMAQDELTDPTQFQITAQEPVSPSETVAGTIGETKKAEATTVAPTTISATTEAQVSEDVVVKDYEVALIPLSELRSAVTELEEREPMQAASVSKQMNSLLQGMEEGNIPLWARPAVTKVEQALAGRGISASSVGRDSLFNAIIGAALPIAQGDAQLEQDANKTNYNARVNALMSDISTDFAARQFNASSENQKNQFMTQLKAQVDSQNASRKDAISQFNASAKNQRALAQAQISAQEALETARLGTQVSLTNIAAENQALLRQAELDTQVDLANTAASNAMAQFNSQLVQQREQFNSQQAAAIEQSNVTWRRQINQANTAGINAVNQANAQNAFNLSNQAQTQLWQEMRDEAHWAEQADQNALDRKAELEATVLARESSTMAEVGGFLSRTGLGDYAADGIKAGLNWLGEAAADAWDNF